MPSIRVPFSIDQSGKVSSTSSLEEIAKQHIIDVLTTDKFERVIRPEYGASAQQLLFEPVDDLLYSEFRMDALQELNRSLTIASVTDIRVRPVSTPVTGDEGRNILEIWVRYTMLPFTQSSFTFQIANPEFITEETTV
jgi:phage baseplate assembly protein W